MIDLRYYSLDTGIDFNNNKNFINVDNREMLKCFDFLLVDKKERNKLQKTFCDGVIGKLLIDIYNDDGSEQFTNTDISFYYDFGTKKPYIFFNGNHYHTEKDNYTNDELEAIRDDLKENIEANDFDEQFKEIFDQNNREFKWENYESLVSDEIGYPHSIELLMEAGFDATDAKELIGYDTEEISNIIDEIYNGDFDFEEQQ